MEVMEQDKHLAKMEKAKQYEEVDKIMNYLNIANNSIFFTATAVIIVFIVVQSLLFIRLALQEGARIGLSKAKMYKALRMGFVSSIVPALAIGVALMAMAPVLGIPISWMRLSVIGSAPYELMAAGVGAKSMGIDQLGGTGYTGQVFANSIWTMCIGSIWAVSITVLFLKKIKSKYSQTVNKDPKWRNILTSAAFMGVFSIFIADPVTSGGLPLITLLAGGLFMTLFAVMIVKLKIEWLREFSLTFSILGAMACAVIVSNLI